MARQLSNDNLILEFDLPEENYRKTRFDWTGKITRVYFRGVPVSGSERKDPPASDWGQAFYNEFGIQEAIGFQEIPIGGWFHKIGVGLLQKTEEEYFFHKDHPVQPCAFSTEILEDQVRIQCHGALSNGYGYELNKTIALHESGFSLSYELINRGQKPLSTNEYCHNFLAIGDKDLDPQYTLRFPFELDAGNFDEVVDPEELVNFQGREITWKGTPSEQFFFSDLSGGKSVRAQWELIHKTLGIGIREYCDFQTNKINLWGWKHVVSPELFFPIFIEPGASKKWTRNYELFTI